MATAGCANTLRTFYTEPPRVKAECGAEADGAAMETDASPAAEEQAGSQEAPADAPAADDAARASPASPQAGSPASATPAAATVRRDAAPRASQRPLPALFLKTCFRDLFSPGLPRAAPLLAPDLVRP
jgi:hypothetical protein